MLRGRMSFLYLQIWSSDEFIEFWRALRMYSRALYGTVGLIRVNFVCVTEKEHIERLPRNPTNDLLCLRHTGIPRTRDNITCISNDNSVCCLISPSRFCSRLQSTVTMSADADTDSQMLSDTSSTPSSTGPSTPPTTTQQQAASGHPSSSIADLSPPDSQHRSSKMANANGKRPLTDISNGPDDDDAMAGKGEGQQKQRQEFPTKTHAASGYTWNSAEGEPGWAWGNKKAVDEANRAFDSLLHRDSMVRGEFQRACVTGEGNGSGLMQLRFDSQIW